ncbi:MAG: glycyl-radical enzyme activating protein [Promethearchaeota archaeon]|nr:MAG: glycyl-radical enzyme activating protein [Candidatus Lokiarchaeota archaeon]
MTEANGLVFEIQKMSTEDGPGIRTTVFFKQCPLKCIWCHNPESILKKPQLEWFKHKCIGCGTCIETCKQSALKFEEDGLHIDRDKCISCGECEEACPSTALHMLGKWWNLNDLFHEIRKDKAYYVKSKGGITVSGGEPTTQTDFLLEFLKKCKGEGISTALDTCGYASREIYEKILPYVDLILLDIKEIDSNRHKEFTGVPNETILENAIWMSNYVKSNNKKIWIRTPIIPHYTAIDDNIRGIGNFIVNKLNNIPERWDLLSFNRLCVDKYSRLDLDWVLKDEPLMTKDEMEKIYEIAKGTGVKNVQWSGLTKKEEHKSN